jgi:hypothetical protein
MRNFNFIVAKTKKKFRKILRNFLLKIEFIYELNEFFNKKN